MDYILDSLDGIPERARVAFVEHEGKFKFDPNKIDDYKELKSTIEKERTAAKEAKAELSKFAGIDPEASRKLQAMFENNEEAQLIAQGKTEEAFQKRYEKRQEAVAAREQELQAKIDAAESRANAYKDRVLDDAFRSAASQIPDIHQSAVDVMLLGHLRTIFSLDDNGHAVQKDKNGNIVIGKDGKSEFSVKEYLEGCRPTMPYLFKVNSSGSPQTGKQISGVTKDLSGMKPTDRLTAAREASMQRK